MKLGVKIKNLREERGLTQVELANLSGISRASIQLYEADKVEIPVKKLSDIATALEVDTDFFIKNKSSLVGSLNSSLDVRKSVVNPSNLKSSQDNDTNIVKIPYFKDTYASAGNGAINYDEVPIIMELDADFLRVFLQITTPFKNMHIINAKGDSMEPTIKDGELLYINPIANEGGINSGSIYVINFDGDVLVKRVDKNPITKALTLISDNQKYKPIDIDKENLELCQVVGRVVAHTSKL